MGRECHGMVAAQQRGLSDFDQNSTGLRCVQGIEASRRLVGVVRHSSEIAWLTLGIQEHWRSRDERHISKA